MATDIHVGFLEMPDGLDEFLAKEGYLSRGTLQDTTIYTPRRFRSPEVFFFPSALEGEEPPYWSAQGYDVRAVLEIFTQKRGKAADRLVERIVHEYDVVVYDSGIYLPSRPRAA